MKITINQIKKIKNTQIKYFVFNFFIILCIYTLLRKMMASKDYDKILLRLVSILEKLNYKEYPTVKDLAKEFKVSQRTIQRDFQRLERFPIMKNENGKYQFDDGFSFDRCNLSIEEMMTISLSLNIIKEAGSKFNESALYLFTKLLKPSYPSPYYIKPPSYEVIDMENSIIKNIERAISENKKVIISYKEKEVKIEPYKITNIDGLWFLLAYFLEEEKTKTFLLSDIKDVKAISSKFKAKINVDDLLPSIHSGFFDDEKTFEVVIKVKPNIANYFKLKALLPSQKILKEYEDGSLKLSYEVSHEEDIDNLVKSWLPDIVVLEPVEYRDKVKKELLEYLEKL